MDEEDGACLREALIRRLLSQGSSLPTSAQGRLGRTGLSLFRGRGILRGEEGDEGADEPAEMEELVRLVTSAGQLKGVAMKAAQVMSYADLALPEDVQEALSALQTHAQPMSVETVHGVLREELGERAGPLVEGLEPEPVAAASIGQVHRCRLPEGPDVALKVQYPEIRRAIESDFRAARIGPALAGLLLPGAGSVEAFVDEARRRLLEECDYEREAAVQARFARLYADHPVLEVPEVHEEISSTRVLATSFVEAPGFYDMLASDPSQERRDSIGEALHEFYVGTLFRSGLFNCDPHPGNYLFPEEGRVVLLDHGCAREFEPGFVDLLARLSRAARREGPDALDEVLVELGIAEPDDPEALATGRSLVDGFYAPFRTDGAGPVDVDRAVAMRRVLERKSDLMRVSLPGSFLFLLRIRFGLASVLARLDARADWNRLEEAYLRQRG